MYVDHFAIFAENRKVLEKVIKLIRSEFDLKVMRTITHFLGVNFEMVNILNEVYL